MLLCGVCLAVTEAPITVATLPPVSANEVYMRFAARFAGGADVVANATKAEEFTAAFASQNDKFFNLSAGATQVLGLTFARSAALRRHLLQSGSLSLDYAVIVASTTDPALLASIRDQSTNNPAAVFGSVASAYGLPAPTVSLTSTNVAATQPPAVGLSTNTPPPTILSPTAAPSPLVGSNSASVQRISSLLMAVLAVAGSAMLMGML